MAKLHDDSGNISHTPYTQKKVIYSISNQHAKFAAKYHKEEKRLHFADSYKLDN